MSAVRILAPAKLNLGLAVLGKRADGYHNIDTILAMVDLYDEIVIAERGKPGIAISGMDDVPLESNLITKAVRLWCTTTGEQPAYDIAVKKRIPSPAGLGGGSSDAAATLRALTMLHGNPLGQDALHQIAGQLGADCPFFLGSPAARATGTGTDLRPIPPPGGAVVVVVPDVAIEAKTATLYGALTADDLAASERIDGIETMLHQGTFRPGVSLANSFTRPVEMLIPEVARIRAALVGAGIEMTITGAGPGFYVIARDQMEAAHIRDDVLKILPSTTYTSVASFLQATPTPEIWS